MNHIDWDRIYDEYEIPENLRQHIRWVARVGRRVAECLRGKGRDADPDFVERLCMIHDMGNIIKFDLNSKMNRELGLNTDYWKAVKEKFIRKYGNDEHMATIKIAKELGFDEEAKALEKLKNIDWNELLEGNDWNIKAFVYADLRVAPYGITTMEERLRDFVERYSDRPEKWKNIDKWRAVGRQIKEICGQLDF